MVTVNSDKTDMAESTSRLLNLPAELRNKIYRLVLVKDDHDEGIPVRISGHERPGLLQTCKEVRSEALEIFYFENIFRIHMPGGDSDPIVKWFDVMRKLKFVGRQMNVKPWLVADSLLRWKHFKLWAQRIHSRQVQGYGMPPTKYKDTNEQRFSGVSNKTIAWTLVMHAMWMAVKLHRQPWSLVEELIDEQAVAIKALMPAWFEE